MYQVVEQTHEENVKMYMKLPKKKLIEMLIECNRMLELGRNEFILKPPTVISMCDNS